ncbi:MAG: hypothetical protein MUO76_18820 [Anaerolineaceae bacterium]|nr:hypothetical protein [Anaerolineaceae bacterium]
MHGIHQIAETAGTHLFVCPDVPVRKIGNGDGSMRKHRCASTRKDYLKRMLKFNFSKCMEILSGLAFHGEFKANGRSLTKAFANCHCIRSHAGAWEQEKWGRGSVGTRRDRTLLYYLISMLLRRNQGKPRLSRSHAPAWEQEENRILQKAKTVGIDLCLSGCTARRIGNGAD